MKLKNTGHALKETATIFDEGEFHEILLQAIEHIQYATDSEDREEEALVMIGEFFHCERVDAVHSFVMGAQRRGGDAGGSNWLMEVALLLQTDNVQMAIRKSMDSAPEVLIHALDELILELEDNPNAIEPYHRFLKDYRNPDVQSAMKMLYALSSGNAGDFTKQVEELIDRNNTMMDKAEKLTQEDKIAGMKIYILLPSLLASFKLMVDMALLLVVFLQNLTFGM